MPTADELYEQAIHERDRGDKTQAVETLKQALALDPNFTIGHGLLAKLYADLAMSNEAVTHARRVVEIEPNDAFSYTALSVIYQRCGYIPEAEAAKARAFQLEHGLD